MEKEGLLLREECWMLTDKYGGSTGVGILFCNHSSKNWFKQKTPINAKSGEKVKWEAGYIHGLKDGCHCFYM